MNYPFLIFLLLLFLFLGFLPLAADMDSISEIPQPPAEDLAASKKKQRAQLYQLLGRLPDDDFETGIWLTPRVDLYSQVTVRTNCYSVPVRAGRPIGPRPTARLPPGRL